MPAGAILISPWVDLTHSFPSVAGDASLDYIPAHGFWHRPSCAWPPPARGIFEQVAPDENDLSIGATGGTRHVVEEQVARGVSLYHNSKDAGSEKDPSIHEQTNDLETQASHTVTGKSHKVSVHIDGELVQIEDQIQIYTTNELLTHPLVSPVLQSSLGGLPPLLVLTGGGELLRDEQIYLAHKAANPWKYPPSEAYLYEYPEAREQLKIWKPTDVQLQVWDDLCHVAPTLSFTRPAKYMYRSIAQFGAWALAQAQRVDIEILDDDDVSVISSDSDTENEPSSQDKPISDDSIKKKEGDFLGADTKPRIGKAGDPLPAFKNHMIRQRVDRNGNIYALEPPSLLPGLQMSPNEIGVVKSGPVRKWIEAQKRWNSMFANEKRNVQNQRLRDMAKGFEGFGNGEIPPPSAAASRRGRDLLLTKEKGGKRSWGMSIWSLWGSLHDQKTVAFLVVYKTGPS